MFVIEDEIHAEIQDGRFDLFADAVEELKYRANIPWNEKPDLAPCSGWKTCGRKYEIVEYDISSNPWKEISRIAAIEISASGVKWLFANSENQ